MKYINVTSVNTIRDSFLSFFGEDIFKESKKKSVILKREAVFTYMNKIMGISVEEIGKATGYTEEAVLEGINNFMTELIIQNPKADSLFTSFEELIPAKPGRYS